MSEDKSRFKIKKGEIEIEYEGKSEEVNARYKYAIDWIKGVPISPTKHASSKEKPEGKVSEEKPEKRGGTRSNIVSKAIDDLVTEGWFNTARKVSDVVAELKRRTVPGAKIKTVDSSLKRRVPKTLDRIRDSDNKWTYIKQ
jgi:hypothetical protein